MDLRSASESASWHALSMLITFESRADERELIFLPLREHGGGEHWASPLEVVSTELHEVSHDWCARTTRLGFLLIRTAAEHFVAWQAARTGLLRLPKRMQRFLGAYVPLLEGIALYAQLDFEAEIAGEPLPSPLTIILEHSEFAFNNQDKPLVERFRIVGDGVRDTRIAGEDNLLQKLFLGTEDDQNHYFIGYLYIKAVQAFWSQKHAELRNPALFLPLVIRVLCDHPVAELALTETLTERDILDKVHATVIAMREQLPQFLTFLKNPSFVESFDFWDVPAQIAAGWHEPVFYDNGVEEHFFGDMPRGPAEQAARWIGNSASLHFHAWRVGKLLEVPDSITVPSLLIRMQCGNQDIRIDLPFLSGLYAKDEDGGAQPTEGEGSLTTGEIMAGLELRFAAELRKHLHETVTLALFITLTRGSAGVALWSKRELKAWYVMSLGPIIDERERIMIVKGLGIAPDERQAFGRAFGDRTDIERRIVVGRNVLLQWLASDERTRALLGQRLNFVMPEHLPSLRERFAFHLFRDRHSDLSPEALAAGWSVFDVPGFPGLHTESFSFLELLPSMGPGLISRKPVAREFS